LLDSNQVRIEGNSKPTLDPNLAAFETRGRIYEKTIARISGKYFRESICCGTSDSKEFRTSNHSTRSLALAEDEPLVVECDPGVQWILVLAVEHLAIVLDSGKVN
jgi:hypothetical protein